jgi:nucleotide-binding universal stress UspA family protein
MYRRILTAVDGSLNAHAAARYAIALARACDASLLVAGVMTSPMTGKDEEPMGQSAAGLVSEAEASGVSAHLLIERGEVVKTLDLLVRSHHIDLVMTASRREDAEHRYFLRSVPQRLMAMLPSSLIIVRVLQLGVLAHPREILVPIIGGSFNNAERVYLVSKLATHFQARVIVFHALEEPRMRGQAVPHAAGASRVGAFVEDLRTAGITPQVRIVTGPLVGQAIMHEAARHRHDLIIMGASQRSLFSQWRRGNPVEEVMRQTPCDLFVCRSRRGL